jgi:hypothetical protein
MGRHHAQTPKEACFEAATEALFELRRRRNMPDIEVDHQRAWTKSLSTGVWRPESASRSFGEIIGSMLKTLRLRDEPPDAEQSEQAETRWDTGQIRIPDVTVKRPDGSYAVIDTKFDRADGTRDTWGTAKGAVSGKDQREDYNEINEQQTGMPNQNLSLDADVCQCPPRNKPPQQVSEEVALDLPLQVPLAPDVGAGLPKQPGIPESPGVPKLPDVPQLPPGAPELPPEVPELPPELPELPPELPELPPELPELPPELPEIPEIPVEIPIELPIAA